MKIRKINLIIIFLFIALVSLIVYVSCAILQKGSNYVIFVSTKGNDSNPGTKAKPLATLEAARDAVRRLKSEKGITDSTEGSVTVYLRGGEYYRTKTFNLEKQDSGSRSFFITYRAYKDEEVIITGGITLRKERFKPIAYEEYKDRIIDKSVIGKILMYDLKADNIDYGGLDEDIKTAPEIFINNEPMTIARWPNEGFEKSGKVLYYGDNGFVFKFSKSRIHFWTKAKDMCMLGYWGNDWYDDVVKVDKLDILNNLIDSKQKPAYEVKEDRRFYVFNLLEELDTPGEYFIDREKGFLYLYLPRDLSKAKIQISQSKNTFVEMKDTSFISFENLTFEASRGDAFSISGGRSNLINKCTIRNLSKKAGSINDGDYNSIQNCQVYNTGTGGVYIKGGDRNTLTASNNFVCSNSIHNYSRIKRTYTPAIRLDGVGNYASHNSIYDGPHTAILFSGNDHRIEFNKVHDVAKETDDVGAIYSGRDWTFRGNAIKYNSFYNIVNTIGQYCAAGIYLDDCMSSAEVYGNDFYKVDNPIFVGGGRDHRIVNNTISNCKNSIHFDDRGLNWNLEQLYENLKKVPYNSKVWIKKYPAIENLLADDNPGLPLGNIIESNIIFNSKEPDIRDSLFKNDLVP